MSAGKRRIVVRTGLALACLAAGKFCPFLGLVMSLVGSLLTISVSIIYPAAVHLSIFKVGPSR